VHLARSDAAVGSQAVSALTTLAAVEWKLFRFTRMHARLVVAHIVRVLEEFSALIALRRLFFCTKIGKNNTNTANLQKGQTSHIST